MKLMARQILRTYSSMAVPTNSSMVKSWLAGGILRVTQDPGASDVITAGGWLLTPKPMYDLLRVYEGLVLMAQRAFDPSAG